MTSLPLRGGVSEGWGGGERDVQGHTLDDGHDGALLDGRRALETVGVDTAQELGLQVHVVEGLGDLVIVGFDLACQVATTSVLVRCRHALVCR